MGRLKARQPASPIDRRRPGVRTQQALKLIAKQREQTLARRASPFQRAAAAAGAADADAAEGDTVQRKKADEPLHAKSWRQQKARNQAVPLWRALLLDEEARVCRLAGARVPVRPDAAHQSLESRCVDRSQEAEVVEQAGQLLHADSSQSRIGTRRTELQPPPPQPQQKARARSVQQSWTPRHSQAS